MELPLQLGPLPFNKVKKALQMALRSVEEQMDGQIDKTGGQPARTEF